MRPNQLLSTATWLLGGCAVLATGVISCVAVFNGSHEGASHASQAHSRRGATASAVIQAKSGSSLNGHATFTAMENGVQVELVL
ncbi:MAG: hypothetical protein O7B99_01195, partial [Planctomycetota bacterium]|nr:hypothetical protein [Planctomycetota bacterium]